MANKIIEHANNSRVGNIKKESSSEKKGKTVKDENILKKVTILRVMVTVVCFCCIHVFLNG